MLEAKMDLGRYKARRTPIVPVSRTFAELHEMLQIAFHWEDYHLHEFLLRNGKHMDRLCASDGDDDDFGDAEDSLGADTDLRT